MKRLHSAGSDSDEFSIEIYIESSSCGKKSLEESHTVGQWDKKKLRKICSPLEDTTAPYEYQEFTRPSGFSLRAVYNQHIGRMLVEGAETANDGGSQSQ